MQVLKDIKVKLSHLLVSAFWLLSRSNCGFLTAPGLMGLLLGKKKGSYWFYTCQTYFGGLLGSCRQRVSGLHYFPFLWFCKDGGSVCDTVITGVQFPAHILKALCSHTVHSAYLCQVYVNNSSCFENLWSVHKVHWVCKNCVPLLSLCWPGSALLLEEVTLWVTASPRHCCLPLINLWGSLSGRKSHPYSPSFTSLAAVYTSALHGYQLFFWEKSPWVQTATPNKSPAFHTVQLTGQRLSGSWPAMEHLFSQLQGSPSSSISLVLS